ncbi:tRNA pseudouridine(38-40) synthase TruA [bacterium]|nr:tRNA pseudouridine(38-40) synthase TruA [bacterium]
MKKIFSEFKSVFLRHAIGLPLTALFSTALSASLPFLRWPLHTAFFCAMLREKKVAEHFPNLFFSALVKHAPFFLIWVFLILPALLIVHFVSGGMTVVIGGTMLTWVLSYVAIAFFVFFFLMHPLAFYLAYSWEIEEKGFLSDLKLLLSYLAHYFRRPFAHLFFTLKCYLVYLSGIVCVALFCVAVPSVLLFPFIYLINSRAEWYRAGMVGTFSIVLLGLGFVFFLIVFLLYACPFLSFVTLRFYEPLAPDSKKEAEYYVSDEPEEPAAAAVAEAELKYWKLTVGYDGTRFCGWQIQPGVRTVQGELEAALKRLLRENVTITAASRTDSGVHALGQTVNFSTAKDIPPEKLLRALNTYTPDDVTVSKIEAVDKDFHSTFSSCGKHYRYTVWTGEADDVMTRNFHLLLRRNLDMDAMREAAAFFIGEKEYKGLQVKSGKPEEATVRKVTAVEVAREGDKLTIDIWGKGFMYKQVRSMAGLLLAVGEGRVKPNETEGLMSGRSGVRKTEVAPPQGLCLVKVYYDQEEFDRRS